MSLATRCPACSTAFRVHADQLSVRGGRVRCGRCAHVFDGVAQLVPEPLAAAEHEPSPQLALSRFERSSRAARGAAPRTVVHEPAKVQPVEEAPVRKPEVEAPRAEHPVQAAGTRPAAEAGMPPGAPWDEARPGPRYRMLWSLLALLALLGLALQGAYRFRTELGVLVPQSRAYLEAACELIECKVGLPRHPDLLSIESSELQMDPQRGATILLRALLRNRAPFPQEYPALELTLTDESDRAVVRKVLQPLDYLGRRAAEEGQGIGGASETPVSVYFDASRVHATGYRLYVFYP